MKQPKKEDGGGGGVVVRGGFGLLPMENINFGETKECISENLF